MLDIIENGINWTKTKNNIKGILTTLSIQYLTNIFCKVTLNSHVQYKSMAHLLWKILQQAIKFNLKKMGEKKSDGEWRKSNAFFTNKTLSIRTWDSRIDAAKSRSNRQTSSINKRFILAPNGCKWLKM